MGAVIDLGDITAACGTEAYLLLWLKMMRAQGTANFTVQVVRQPTGPRHTPDR